MKLAVAGAGYFSAFHFDAWSRIPEIELVGVCDQNKAAAEARAKNFEAASVFAEFTEMLQSTKPDLVDIATPPSTHFEFAQAALSHGCHVICQKPFTLGHDQARVLVELAEQSPGKLIVHENFRFQPWYREIARQLAAGRLGDLYQATFFLRPGDGQTPNAYLDRQPYFQTMPRFLIHETGVHWVDVFRYLFGDSSWVNADLRKLNPAIAGEDAGIVLFGSETGFRAILDGNRLSDMPAGNLRLTMGMFKIEGSEGSITMNGDGALSFRAFGETENIPIALNIPDRGFGGDCVYALQRHIIDHLTKGTPLENEAEAYLYVLEAEAAIYRSAEEGRRVKIGL